MEVDTGVIDEGQCMTCGFRHGDDLGTGVKDRFDVLIMVDEGQNGGEGGRLFSDHEAVGTAILQCRAKVYLIGILNNDGHGWWFSVTQSGGEDLHHQGLDRSGVCHRHCSEM